MISWEGLASASVFPLLLGPEICLHPLFGPILALSEREDGTQNEGAPRAGDRGLAAVPLPGGRPGVADDGGPL
ncbi:unnamed protein product, partial [Cyprideis torosa]